MRTAHMFLPLALLACGDKGGDDTGDGDVNLTVAGFLHSGSDGNYDFEVLVENTGSDDAGAFSVGLYVDWTGDPVPGDSATKRASVSGLDAGEVKSVGFSISNACSGCDAYALVDADDDLFETDEHDNVAGPDALVGR